MPTLGLYTRFQSGGLEPLKHGEPLHWLWTWRQLQADNYVRSWSRDTEAGIYNVRKNLSKGSTLTRIDMCERDFVRVMYRHITDAWNVSLGQYNTITIMYPREFPMEMNVPKRSKELRKPKQIPEGMTYRDGSLFLPRLGVVGFGLRKWTVR